MLIDFHCDTILKMMKSGEKFNFKENEMEVDLSKLKKANSMAQFFACFVDKKEYKDPLERALDMIDKFYCEIDKNKDSITLAKNYEDIIKNYKEGKISGILTIEGGEALKGKLSNLRNFYKLGVRLVTLTWNYQNEIGYPGCVKEFKEKGLTKFGEELIYEMNKLGMLIDVSHLSDGGFYDAIKYSSKPIIASHSNSREVKSSTRNLTDDMIKTLAENGGIMGLNFCNDFLSREKIATVKDMVKHIKHIVNVGGLDIMAIGTDFDGIENPPKIQNIGEMSKLVEELISQGFKEDSIDKIFYKNALRVIKEVL